MFKRTKFESISWNLLKTLLAIVLFGYLLSKISFHDLVELKGRFSIPWLLGSMIAFYAGIWAMSRRYWILIDHKVPFLKTLDLVVFQTVIGNLITPGLGFASYITVLRKKYDIQLRRGILSILLARFLDLTALLIALVLSTSFLYAEIRSIQWIVSFLISSLLFIVSILIMLVINRKWFVEVIRKINFPAINLFKQTVNNIYELTDNGFDELRGKVRPLGVFSLVTFFSTFIYSYCSFKAFAVPIGPWHILFMVSITQLISLVPVHILGGIGTMEVTNLYLFGIFGFENSEIIPILLGLRIFFYIFNVFLIIYNLLENRINPSISGNSALDSTGSIAQIQKDET